MQQNCWKLGPERLKNKAFASFHLFLFIIFCKCQYVCLTVSAVPPSYSSFSISFPYYSTKRQKSTITYRHILTRRNPAPNGQVPFQYYLSHFYKLFSYFKIHSFTFSTISSCLSKCK